MPEPVPQMRFWGWGESQHAGALPEHALGFLRETIGIAERPRPPVAIEQVALAPSRLSQAVLSELAGICGAGHVGAGHAERVLHAAGKGYPDLVRLRAGGGGFRWATESADHLLARGSWDPLWFVDACAAVQAGLLSRESAALLEEIQRAELQLLLDAGSAG